jgi:2-polyprenyl-6-methoxyphenol hydroxylase-like FAD-dependent oxidoreductase
MFDGAELAQAIVAHPDDVEAALSAYEKELFPRSAAEAAAAEGILEVCLGPNAPQSLVDFFTSNQPVQ